MNNHFLSPRKRNEELWRKYVRIALIADVNNGGREVNDISSPLCNLTPRTVATRKNSGLTTKMAFNIPLRLIRMIMKWLWMTILE